MRLLLAVALAAAAAPASAALNAADFVKLVLAASPEIRQARESFAAADDAYKSAFAAAALPSATFSWNDALWGNDPAAGSFHRLRFKRNDQTTTTGATLNLFNGFKDALGVSGSKKARDSAGVSLTLAEQTRALVAIQAFYHLAANKRLVEVASVDLAAQEEQFHRTEALYRAGMKGQSDVYKSETEWRSSQVRLISAESAYKSSLEPFNSLVNRSPWSDAELAAELDPGTTDLPRLEEDAARLSERLPELAVARLATERARVAARQSLLGVLPSVSAGASWTRADPEGRRWWSGPDQRALSLTVSLPIGFNFVKQAYDQGAANAALRSALDAEDLALRQARDALFSAWIALEAATKTYALAVRQEEIAQRGLEIVEKQYNQGSADALRMAQARTDLLNARVQTATSLQDIFLNRAAYRRAAGVSLW